MYRNHFCSLMLTLTCLISVVKHLHRTEEAERAPPLPPRLAVSFSGLSHFPLSPERWTAPWLESAPRSVQRVGGSSHLCCSSQCRSSSSLLPSVCAQRTQLKPGRGGERAASGPGPSGTWGCPPGSLDPGWAPSCFASISTSF